MTNTNKNHEFLTHIENNVKKSPAWTIDELLAKAGGVENVYLVYVDIIKGFCDIGPLSSVRVREMVQPVKALTDSLLERGLLASNLIFLQDAHPEQAVEFTSFAPHCVQGTIEAEIVDELRSYQDLPGVQVYSKNATNGLFGVNQEGIPFHEAVTKILARKARSTFVMVGDCTDLCIYQNTMGIRLLANEQNADVEVIVPISHVRTYDLPIDVANEIGAFAHNADFFDIVFLYHMKANGITLVTNLSEKKEE
ncbi:cysteine hydrolase family protein [Thermoactinomyces sp. DSM 45892]|uniref:cysteine hydrolase family protein n=1 Tax=Thermoactinomyces sp. DSM 45892 TaxID=1882753 RepID=UPI0008959C7C|nr:isochorismatase family protein [Thermoactinomyces sp. DSM 45892]SDY68101.1 Nicotinamidase-related amidase [Thermoactinomyces sp. DSM 45892]